MAIRFLYVVIAILAVTMLPASAQRVNYDERTDRPGGGVIRTATKVGTARQCGEMCRRIKNCRAFVWVRPGIDADHDLCRLKRTATDPVPNRCCVSGVVARKVNDRPPCPCVDRKTGRRYRARFGLPGCPPPDSPQADFDSCN